MKDSFNFILKKYFIFDLINFQNIDMKVLLDNFCFYPI